MSSLPALDAQPMDVRDAVRRLVDEVNLHVMAVRETRHQRSTPPFIGISLATGKCIDGVLYDSRRDCARHLCAKDPYVFPVRIGPMDITEREAWVILYYARAAKVKGVAFHEEEPILPMRLEQAGLLIPRTAGLLLPRGNPTPHGPTTRRRR